MYNCNQNIKLSVVATSRNDNHGGDLLSRMQHFSDGFLEQCESHKIYAELILVDWNPPSDKPPLSEILKFPENRQYSTVRIISVPQELHDKLENSTKITLFQMIAKNVGIRRAKGEFILATNIDILFSNEFFCFFSKKIAKNLLYRSDRIDVSPHPSQNDNISQKLLFCSKNMIRRHSKSGSYLFKNKRWIKCREEKRSRSLVLAILSFSLLTLFNYAYKIVKNGIFFFSVKLRKLHTNGCGDFTLLSKENWFFLRGYPEWPIFSWHLDSVLLYQAYLVGIKEKTLRKIYHYHLEHGVGSGYIPENSEPLFSRLDKNKIPYLSWEKFNSTILEMKEKKTNYNEILYNDTDWGFSNHDLHETQF